MLLAAALLAGIGWLARLSVTRHRAGIAIAPVPSVAVGTTTGPKTEGGEPVEPASDVMQQLTLRATAEGGQELSGWLRMPLAAGNAPALSTLLSARPSIAPPRSKWKPWPGRTAASKRPMRLPYGVRIEVKVDGASG